MTDELSGKVVSTQSVYALIGLLLALACIIVGGLLIVSGINGNSHAPGSIIGMSALLNDAILGFILFVIGVGAVWMIRFKRHAGTVTGA